MKFLVTGGAGFIGSHIVEKLLSDGHEVSIIDNFSTGKRENISQFIEEVKLFEEDIRDFQSVLNAMKDIDFVYHQAALSSVHKSIEDPIATNDINIRGTLNILETARASQVKKVIFASSAAVYGDDPELPKHETMLPYPLSPYALSKFIGEQYCKLYTDLYGLNTVSLRYFNVYGPRQDPNSDYAAVIPKFITSMLVDENPVIFGDGLQTRDFIYIDDVVNANIRAATTDCYPYLVMNCASGIQVTVNDLAQSVNKILCKNINFKYDEAREGDIKYSFADVTLLKELLNIDSETNLEDGLKRTIESFSSKWK